MFTGSDFKACVQNAFAHVRTVSFFAPTLQHMALSLAASLWSLPLPNAVSTSFCHHVDGGRPAGALCRSVLRGYTGVGSRGRIAPSAAVKGRLFVGSRSHRLRLMKLYSSWLRPLKIAASDLRDGVRLLLLVDLARRCIVVIVKPPWWS